MNIDFFIKNISDDKIIGRGFEKNCYDFDNVVLLETRYLTSNSIENKMKNILIVRDILNKIDVNGYKIFDFKIYNDKLYVLESKVKGSSLQDTSIGLDSSIYINRLKQLDDFDILRKFVNDYFLIIDNGLSVDAGRPTNFLFDDKIGVSFIDLSVADEPIDKKYICFYILYNIIYTHCDIKNADDITLISFYIKSIYMKLISIYKELGYDESMYNSTPNGTVDDFIIRKISRFIKYSNLDMCNNELNSRKSI